MTMGIIGNKSLDNAYYYEIQIAVQFNECKYFHTTCSHCENGFHGDYKYENISLVLNLNDPITGSDIHFNIL